MTFNHDITASISGGDLQIVNTTTNTAVPGSNLDLSMDPATDSATWTFKGFAGNSIPDGAYVATLPAAGVSDAAGNHPSSDIVFGFSFLNGDANEDTKVNALDFNALASHFGDASADFSQGDFNYDGKVDTHDFSMLVTRFNDEAAPLPAGTIVAATAPLPGAASASASLFSNASPIREDATGAEMHDLLAQDLLAPDLLG